MELTQAEKEERLAASMRQAIDDNNPSRSVQQLVSTGVATGPEVPKLIMDKCPQAKVFDFEAQAAALIPPSMQ